MPGKKSKPTATAKPKAKYKKAPAKKRAAKAEPEAAQAAPAQQTLRIVAPPGRAMLQWVGKRTPKTVTAFPAQHVETFNPDDRKGNGGLLFHGDNKEVLAHLLANGFRGKMDLIYIDPPFDSGADYVRKVSLRGKSGIGKIEGETYTLGEQIQYTDIWANDNYLQFMYERLILMKGLLSESGKIFVHCDSGKNHHLRCLLDEIFGADSFCNEIIWFYENKLGTGGNTFDSFHDSLLVYSKGTERVHNSIKIAVKEIKQQPVTQKVDGKRVWLRDDEGKRLYQESNSERSLGDVWIVPIINPVGNERLGYPTQKPIQLLEHVICSSSDRGGLVLDCFIGSGTTAAVAQKLGRRWIGCDINKGAIQTTSKRLQNIITEQLESTKDKELITDENAPPAPAQFSFSVHRVNDYDLQIQHNEAVALACEHIGVTRSKSDPYFDGTQGKRLVKIIPFTHPLSPADLDQLADELKTRKNEERNILVVALGKELAADAWLEDWNRLRKKGSVPNKIEVIELRTDPKYGKFIQHKPAQAKVKVKRAKGTVTLTVEDFISPSILERLEAQSGLLKAQVTDWRSMVDCILIGTNYDGEVFNIALSDIPEKKDDLVQGTYELSLENPQTPIAIKIIDMLGEEVVQVFGK